MMLAQAFMIANGLPSLVVPTNDLYHEPEPLRLRPVSNSAIGREYSVKLPT